MSKSKPLTPESCGAPLLPAGWGKPFSFLTDRATASPEIAAFCGVFLGALNGNEDALRRVLIIAMSAYHYAAKNKVTAGERATVNAMVVLTNMLCEKIEAEEAQKAAEEKAAVQPAVISEVETKEPSCHPQH